MTQPDKAGSGRSGKRNRKDDNSLNGEPQEAGTAGEAADAWRKRKCPECGKPAREVYRPFCSRRCADLDLARWLGGHYAIAATDTDDEASDPPPPNREET